MPSELTPRLHDAQIAHDIKNLYQDFKKDHPAEQTLISPTICQCTNLILEFFES